MVWSMSNFSWKWFSLNSRCLYRNAAFSFLECYASFDCIWVHIFGELDDKYFQAVLLCNPLVYFRTTFLLFSVLLFLYTRLSNFIPDLILLAKLENAVVNIYIFFLKVFMNLKLVLPSTVCSTWFYIYSAKNQIIFPCVLCSDEKYQQFQADQNLQYTCAACRGDCYQVLYAFWRFIFMII